MWTILNFSYNVLDRQQVEARKETLKAILRYISVFIGFTEFWRLYSIFYYLVLHFSDPRTHLLSNRFNPAFFNSMLLLTLRSQVEVVWKYMLRWFENNFMFCKQGLHQLIIDYLRNIVIYSIMQSLFSIGGLNINKTLDNKRLMGLKF